jgi:hypothetical protein
VLAVRQYNLLISSAIALSAGPTNPPFFVWFRE